MKSILTAIFALGCFTSAFAGEYLDAAALKNVQTYDVGPLLEKETSLLGRVVAVRFHYRSAKLRHLKPRWYEASIWQLDPKAKKGYSGLRVMVEKQDVAAFESITADTLAAADMTLYARVEKDEESNLVHLRLLGRKLTKDAAGNATIAW